VSGGSVETGVSGAPAAAASAAGRASRVALEPTGTEKGEMIAMKKVLARLALVALVLAAASVVPDVATAQYREYTGRIDKIDAKKMIVDDRRGEKITFLKVDGASISVQEGFQPTDKKEGWDDLKKGDWVMVSWKMEPGTRKAYQIKVLPPKEEAGTDE
jgi:hypothetical protein